MARPKKARGAESKFHGAVTSTDFSVERKGRIAEAAVLYRLMVHGFEVYSGAFDGAKSDWLVVGPKTGKTFRLQVKWAAVIGHSLPIIRLRCSSGRNKSRKYRCDEVDFVVGYDFYTDTAYVYPFSSVERLNYVSIKPQAAERWDLLKGL